jgi:hypothetical protein
MDGQGEEGKGLRMWKNRLSFFGTETSYVTQNICVQILNNVTEFI